MVQLKVGSVNLFLIKLRAQLIGPSPMHISGKATFGILWWDYTVSFDKTLAGGERPPLPAPVDAGALLSTALHDRGNWSHEISGNDRALVTVREQPSGDEILIHPLSRLSLRQRVVPLDREIARSAARARAARGCSTLLSPASMATSKGSRPSPSTSRPPSSSICRTTRSSPVRPSR